MLGPNKTLFYAHSNLLAQCSPVLDKSVNGEMREKQLETIEIEDVNGDIDDDTVERFIEYAYRGDYTVPNPDYLQLADNPKELQVAFVGNGDPVLENGDSWALPSMSKKDRMKKKKRAPSPLPDEIETLDEPCPERVPGPSLHVLTIDSDRQNLWNNFCSSAKVVSQAAWQPSSNSDKHESYTPVFLCHARLYKFSDRYDCKELMDLALQKLRLTLARYIFHKERASDVVELINYTYAHTLHSDQWLDRLRALVLDYATCYFRELIQDPSFVELCREGGCFPSDLMAKVAELVS